jgi:SAM-dependent methyltransferase
MGQQLLRRDACPGCSSTSHGVLYDCPFDRAPISDYLLSFYGGRCDPARLSPWHYTLAECDACSLVFQEHVPDAELLRSIYGEWILREESHDKAEARGLNLRRMYAFQIINLIEYFRVDPSEVEVLDYGLGWGIWLQMAAALGCKVSGVEFSDERRDRAIERAVEVFDETDLPEGRFHFINTEQVFEHLTAPLEIAARLRRALRPGGMLRISVPNGSDIKDRLARGRWDAPKSSPDSLNAVAPLEHLNCFDYRSLVTMTTRAGLREVRIPLRQFLSPWQPVRFVASALVHAVRRPRGTVLLFESTP